MLPLNFRHYYTRPDAWQIEEALQFFLSNVTRHTQAGAGAWQVLYNEDKNTTKTLMLYKV